MRTRFHPINKSSGVLGQRHQPLQVTLGLGFKENTMQEAVDNLCGGAMVLRRAWEQRPPWLLKLPARKLEPLRGLGFWARKNEASRVSGPSRVCFASVSTLEIAKNGNVEVEQGSRRKVRFDQLLMHPLALMHYVPNDLALFFAGALAGAAAKSLTAPLDRVKLLMQVHGLKAAEEGTKKKGIGFIEAIAKVGQNEGFKGYWKGNLPQVIRVIPYSAVQLFAYEVYKKLFKGNKDELSVIGRLAAGGCAGMTSTLLTYPLDVLRLRLAVDPASKTMSQVALNMLHEEGLASFYKGLGPSLIGIAPYIAINFCVFDLIKKTLPEDFRKRPEASFATAIASATFATLLCYPLDTVRRQMQMKGSPFNNLLDAFPGIVARDGLAGLYRGFVPNALKNLPNSSVRLTTFDAAKNLIHAGEEEYQKVLKKVTRD